MLDRVIAGNRHLELAYDRFADLVIARAQQTPYSDLPNYQNRWWLIPPTDAFGFHFSARVHEILRSDLERDMHDHPCASISVILKVGYLENMPLRQSQASCFDTQGLTRSRVRRPGAIVIRRATDRHRLTLNDDQPCWSIFAFISRNKMPWGFYTKHGWVWWRIYLDDWAGLEPEEISRAAIRDPLVTYRIPAHILESIA